MSEPFDGARRPRDKPWIFRTYAGHSTAQASNALYRNNLGKGQTGLSVAFDLPTQTGYDSDHPLAKGEVGKGGIKGKKPGRRRVDRHRRVHVPERDVIEQRAHVVEVRDRHADLADLALGERVIAVVAGLGGEIEGDGESGLTLAEVLPIERIRVVRGRMSGVSAEDPGPVAPAPCAVR